MSRIGKKPVEIPSGVAFTLGKNNRVSVKGPKGELKQTIDRDIVVEINDNIVEFKRPTDQIRHRAMHGLYRSLIVTWLKELLRVILNNLNWLVLVIKHQIQEIF